jgi:tRNA1(Val) A37 N6-methylase TrmN6
MQYHPTPPSVASVLARYAPKHITNLLDPAVGKGSLLVPFAKRRDLPRSITCVDFDGSVLRQFPSELKLKLGAKLKFIASDFLTWASRDQSQSCRFDCIIVNPPFLARNRVRIPQPGPKGAKPKTRRVPVELAFLVKCIEMLADSGRLLAVLPSSAITCSGTRWFREFLFQRGAVTRVHEIPPNTFRGVEGRTFLLVFDKSRHQRNITLCNSDLFRPRKLKLQISTLLDEMRLDYSFHKATEKQIRRTTNLSKRKGRDVTWASLTDLADIFRGNVEAPFENRLLHTTDRQGPFWISTSRMKPSTNGLVSANPRDILASRVGRQCSNSVGLYCGAKAVTISDCVIVIRPKLPTTEQLLFAFRVLLKFASTSALLERGTGASYITIDALASLLVPSNLHMMFPHAFRRYLRAIRARRANVMLSIEVSVAEWIGLQKGRK